MLINATELYDILNLQNLIVIDTRSFKEYSEGHIPGSVNLDLFGFHWIDTTKMGLENFVEQAQTLFSYAGITSEKKVVFYDDVSGMTASRGVWMLMYFSHPDASILDGGIKQWKNHDFPIETKSNPFKASKFSARINPDLISGFEYVRDNLDKLKMIDARSRDEYNGVVIRAAHAGHIPNSINIDWNQNITPNGDFKSDEELTKIYQIPKNSEVVVYCQGAYRAANTFLALKKIGFKNVRVYLGSWQEWGNKDLPVEK